MGTTAPGDKLHIVGGGVLSEGTFHFGSSAANALLSLGYIEPATQPNTSYLKVAGGGNNSLQLGAASGGFIALETNPGTGRVTRLKVDVNGNVGIGTTAPASILHLAAATPTQIFQATGVASKGYVFGGNNNIGLATNRHPFTGTLDNVALASWNLGLFNSGDFFDIARAPAGSSTATSLLRINSSGNVGIGTTAPTSALTLASTSLSTAAQLEIHNVSAVGAELYTHSDTGFRAPTVLLNRSGGTQSSPTAVPNSYRLGYFQLGGYNGSTYLPSAEMSAIASQNWTSSAMGTDLFFSTTANGSTSPSERLRITQAGNVGIGIALPTERLHVAGNALVAGTLTVTQPVTFQSTLTVTGNATFSGNITLNGKLIGNANTRGQVTIASATTSANYTFPVAYAAAPNVIATPTSNPGANFWVSNVTTTGFTVNLAAAPAAAVTFNFQAQQ